MSEQRAMDAMAALAHASKIEAAVLRRTKWYVGYLVIFSAAAFVMMLILGLAQGPVGVTVSVVLWIAVIAGLSVYSARQPVVSRGFGLRHGVIIGIWAVLYTAALLLGLNWFQDEPAWWIFGAVLVSLPGFIGAYLEARR